MSSEPASQSNGIVSPGRGSYPIGAFTGLVSFSGAEFVRFLDLGHSVIDGDLLLARTSVAGEGQPRIVFNEVKSHLSLDSAHVKGDVNVHGARITDNLSLRGAEIGGAFIPRLQDQAEIAFSLLVRRRE